MTEKRRGIPGNGSHLASSVAVIYPGKLRPRWLLCWLGRVDGASIAWGHPWISAGRAWGEAKPTVSPVLIQRRCRHRKKCLSLTEEEVCRLKFTALCKARRCSTTSLFAQPRLLLDGQKLSVFLPRPAWVHSNYSGSNKRSHIYWRFSQAKHTTYIIAHNQPCHSDLKMRTLRHMESSKCLQLPRNRMFHLGVGSLCWHLVATLLFLHKYLSQSMVLTDLTTSEVWQSQSELPLLVTRDISTSENLWIASQC